MRGSSQPFQALAIGLIFSAIASSSSGSDVRCWAWQRDDPLDERELAELVEQQVDTIYWHVGELEVV